MCLELRLDLYNLESQQREFLPPGFRHLQTLEMTHFLPTKTPRLYPCQFSQFSHFQLTLHSFFFKSVTAKLSYHTTADQTTYYIKCMAHKCKIIEDKFKEE